YEEKTITPLKNEKGDITHFVSTGKDITARMLVENENRRMQAFLNSVVENLPNMLFVKDAKDLRFVRFNKAAEELLGYSRDEMLGKNDYDFFTKEEADFFTAKDREVLDSRQPHDIPEESIHTKHKGTRLLHTQKIPILDEAGKPLYLLGLSEDITERKTSEDLLARLGRILDHSSNEVYVFCADTLRFMQVNQGARQNLGYTLEELKALTPLDLKPEFTRPEFEALIAPLRRGEQDTMTFETVHQRKDGSLYPVEVRLQFSRNEIPPVFFAIIQDITERKKAEDTLRASEEGLAHAQRIAHLGNWNWDLVTGELRWSDEVYHIFGLKPQQSRITTETFLNAVHPDDRTSVTETANQAITEKLPFDLDFRIIQPTGSNASCTNKPKSLSMKTANRSTWSGPFRTSPPPAARRNA
ncbi:MAG: PAS domain S-box protein, partial [Pseudomonadota bacterium]